MKRIPVATELGRHDRFWPAALASIAVHAAAIAIAVKASSLPAIELRQTPIKARLVRLGEKKPENYLPQKESPPAPAPPPTAPAPPAAEPPPTTPPPAAPPAPTAKAPPTTAPTKPSARPASARPGATAGGGIASALARYEKDVQRERWGDPNGDPEGDSDEGSEGERYLALLVRALQANYQLPTTIPEKERLYLQSVVILWIDGDGRIVRWKMEKPSGNPAFDDALERAIGKTHAPPPPDAERRTYRDRGVEVTFNTRDRT